MTVRRAVKAYMADHPETVEGALKGDFLAVDSLARNVLRYMQIPRTEDNMERAEAQVYRFLEAVENGDKPLWGTWRSKSVKDIEFYIKYCKEEVEEAANPAFQEVLFDQWDEAYNQWILKGGNVVHENPLPVGEDQ